MCRIRLFYESCFGDRMGFAEMVMSYEDDIASFIKFWKTGGRIVITEHIDLVQIIMLTKYKRVSEEKSSKRLDWVLMSYKHRMRKL